MSHIENNCCVCLNNIHNLNKLSQEDENNKSLLIKLTTTVPEISWFITYQICEPCTNLLNVVYHFRETCFKSDLLRQQANDVKFNIKHEESDITAAQNAENKDLCSVDKDSLLSDADNGDCNDSGSSEEEIFVDECIKVESNKETKETKKRKRNFEFNCEQCSTKYTSSKDLVEHCVSEHEMQSKDVRPFSCTRCTSRFANSSNLLQHIKYHDAVRCNVCSYCGKGFITKTDLKTHEKQHLNKREYSCQLCRKSFNTHKDLRSHKLVVHTDPDLWKYLCNYCQKKFPIKSNYDSHMRRHTGEKNFECHLCYRKFADKCVLQRHMRTHSNIREFRCSECSKEYKEKRVMQIHMAKIHGIGVGEIKLPSKERKYFCHMCPKAYYAKNKLTRHLYTHTGEKPFFCEICNKKFNDKSYVKQHMKKTHNVKLEDNL